MKQVKILALGIILLLAACGAPPKPNNTTNGPTGPDKPGGGPVVDTPQPSEKEIAEAKCYADRNDPTVLPPYYCACILDGSDSDSCKCAEDPSATLANGGTCACLENPNDPACACYSKPNGDQCYCSKDEHKGEARCQKEVFTEDQVCRKLQNGEYTPEQLKEVGATNNPDSLPDELKVLYYSDCDHDGLATGVELHPRVTDTDKTYSDPLNADTDGDGLNDNDEKTRGSDPRLKDTDGDGLDDNDEVQYGLDPSNKYSTKSFTSSGDKAVDGDAWMFKKCAELVQDNKSSTPGQIFASYASDWRIVLPLGDSIESSDYDKTVQGTNQNKYYNVNQLGSGSSRSSLLRYYDDAGVYGALYTGDATDLIDSRQSGTKTDQLAQTITNRIKGLKKSGTSSPVSLNFALDFSGNKFTTADGYDAVVYEASVTTPSITPTALLQDIIYTLSGSNSNIKTSANFNGAPNEAATSYYIRITGVYRGPKLTPILLIALAKTEAYQKNGDQQTKMRLEDFTNTSNLGRAHDRLAYACNIRKTQDTLPQVYFYFVLDESGSMTDYNNQMKSNVKSFLSLASQTSIDYRVGITHIIPNDSTAPDRENNTWSHSSSDFFDGAVLGQGWTKNASSIENDVQQVASHDGGRERGLYMAYNGITKMLNSTDRFLRIPSGATIITTIYSDEDDDSYTGHSAFETPHTTGWSGVSTYKDYVTKLVPLTTGFTICKPTVCTAFTAFALATGGAYSNLFNNDQLGIFNKVIEKASTRSSNNKLPVTPVSTTLILYKSKTYQPNPSDEPQLLNASEIIYRSRSDGFDYEPGSQSISFFGSAKSPELKNQADGKIHLLPQYVVSGYFYFLRRSKS